MLGSGGSRVRRVKRARWLVVVDSLAGFFSRRREAVGWASVETGGIEYYPSSSIHK